MGKSRFVTHADEWLLWPLLRLHLDRAPTVTWKLLFPNHTAGEGCATRPSAPPPPRCFGSDLIWKSWFPVHAATTPAVPPPPRRRQNHLGHHSSLSHYRRFRAPRRHRSIPCRPPRHRFGPHSRPQVCRCRILAGVMPLNILLNPVSVYTALTVEIDVDYTST
jgi:hypothetical protein